MAGLRRAAHKQRRRLHLEALEPRLVLDASMLRITELLASNDNGITDYQGESSDWLEIYNSGNDLVDLSGLYLTDTPANLTRWQIPNGVTLEGGGYMVVFASSKNGVFAGGELHTNFALSADGEFLALVGTNGTTIIDQYDFPAQFEDVSYGVAMQTVGTPTTLVASGAQAKAIRPTSDALGTAWRNVGYNDSAWPISGPTGLGYDTNPSPVNFASQIGTTLPTGTTSVYIRLTFQLDTLADVDRLLLRMKYDDGYVAYINGVEVAQANAPEFIAWNALATTIHEDTEAIVFEDVDVSSAIPYLVVGQNVLAIQGLNAAAASSDLLILPELISQSMVIVEPTKVGYFDVPTPGYGNGDNFAGFAENPTFSVPHGFYSTAQNVAMSTPTPGAIIVYTTNGSTPQVDANLNITNGTLYTGPINVSSTTTLRARAFKQDFKASFVSASTYIFVDDVINQSPLGQVPPGFAANGVNGQELNYGIDPDIIALYGAQAVKDSLLSISTISITTDAANLFNPTTGIYVNATNRGRSWEREATVELINPDGTPGFDVNAGLRIRGGYSRNDFNPKHGFRFYFRGEYGDSRLRYALFGDEGTDVFDVLDLRTEQNYSWSSEGNLQNSFVREIFGRDTQADMGSEYTRSRYHHLYINGVYWGVFMTQERVEEFYAETYFGGDETDYDVVKSGLGDVGGTEVSAGNDIAWRQLFNYGEALAANPTGNANVYWAMQGLNTDGTRNSSLPVLLDVDNLIDYMTVIFYTGGFDTGISRFLGDNQGNNWFGLYNRVTADQGFQFFIHDNEHSLGADGTFHGSQSIDRTGPFNNGNQSNFAQFNPQYLHQDLLVHPEYRQRFIDRVQTHFFNDGALTVQASIDRMMMRVLQVDPAIIAESARWGDSKVTVPRNKTHWQNEINWLINTYFPSRGNTVLNQLRNDGLFTTFSAPSFSQFGGEVPYNYQLTIGAATGTIYYSTDGVTDPRLIGGNVNMATQVYSGPVPITGETTVMARVRTAAGQWSGLVMATFTTPPPPVPGDFDGNGMVDQADYLFWKTSFGDSVTPGTGADGNGDGKIDIADYTVWRNNLPAPAGPEFSFNAIGQTYAQDFDAFRGTEATLPDHFTVSVVSGTSIYRDTFNSTTDTAASFTGIKAATSDGSDYSFAWRESTGAAALEDTRVLFAFTNNTGQALAGFEVSYDVEAWVNGRRDNQLRFKYDVYADSEASQAGAGRSAFETDIFATLNPNHTPIAANGDQFVLDGKAEANRVTVGGYVDLTTLLVNEANPGLGVFGPLLPGQTAYFRWQISNGVLGDGNRSALGFDNLSITALATAPASGSGGVALFSAESTVQPPSRTVDLAEEPLAQSAALDLALASWATSRPASSPTHESDRLVTSAITATRSDELLLVAIRNSREGLATWCEADGEEIAGGDAEDRDQLFAELALVASFDSIGQPSS